MSAAPPAPTLDARDRGAGRARPAARRRDLREAIRIPADYVDRPADAGRRPAVRAVATTRGRASSTCGASMVEIGRVAPRRTTSASTRSATWSGRVEDPATASRAREKRVVYFDGHCRHRARAARRVARRRSAAARPLPRPGRPGSAWTATYLRASWATCRPTRSGSTWSSAAAPPTSSAAWSSQIVATRILLELAPEGALRGVIVRCYVHRRRGGQRRRRPALRDAARAARRAAPSGSPTSSILTEPTGDSKHGRAAASTAASAAACRSRSTVTGRSCHGSMPWEGLNPLEHGGAILAEAARRLRRAATGFLDHAVPRPRHAHGVVGARSRRRATARCRSASRSASTAA